MFHVRVEPQSYVCDPVSSNLPMDPFLSQFLAAFVEVADLWTTSSQPGEYATFVHGIHFRRKNLLILNIHNEFDVRNVCFRLEKESLHRF